MPLQMESAIPVETLSSQLTTTLWLYLEPGKFLDRAAGALSEAVVGSRVLLRLSAAMFVVGRVGGRRLARILGRHLRVVIQIENLRVETIAAVAEGQWPTAELDDRSGGRVDAFESHGIRVHLEDLRVSIPGGQVGLSGEQEPGLTMGSPSTRHDKAVAEAVKRVDHQASAELNQHVLKAFELVFGLGSLGRGQGVIEDHRVRELLARQRGGDPWIAQLGPVEELLHRANDINQVANLDLGYNQLGAEGGALVTAALKTNTTLTRLECAQLGRPSNRGPRVSLPG